MESLFTMAIPLVGCVTAIGLAGCGDPHAGQYTRSSVAKADAVGKYLLAGTHGTVTKGCPNAVCEIVLRADGTSVATQCGNGGMGTEDGTWSLEKCQFDQPWACLRILSAHGGDLLHFAGEKPPYDLIMTVGDPDSGDAYVFKRAPDGKP